MFRGARIGCIAIPRRREGEVKKLGLLTAIVLALSVAPAASAQTADISQIFQDCGIGCQEPIDFVGPYGFGVVTYNVVDSKSLRVTIVLRSAAAGATYPIFFTCGPTHDEGCGYFQIGELTTNSDGNAVTTVFVPLAELEVFGQVQTDHIDILDTEDFSKGVYVAGGINFSLP